MKLKTILFLLALCPILSWAQVHYDVDSQVEATVDKHVAAWDKVGKVGIYCIQISSLSGEGSGARAQAAVNELNHFFSSNGIDACAYTIFAQPNHKVRVGKFLTKREAYHVMTFLLPQYPGAFITHDQRKIGEWLKDD